MAAACTVVPIRTLYDIESDLHALLECVDTVTPEQEADFAHDLGHALMAAKDKREIGRAHV